MSTIHHIHVAARGERVRFSGDALAQIVGETLARRLCSATRHVSDNAEEEIIARLTAATHREIRWRWSALAGVETRETRWHDAVHVFEVLGAAEVVPQKPTRKRK